MALGLSEVFDEYPNPFYIIRPFVSETVTTDTIHIEDFEYVYANQAFALLLGKNQGELLGHHFLEIFGSGEREWLDAFASAALQNKHLFIDNISVVINKKMYTEIFHIEPGMCGCIVHDYEEISQGIENYSNEVLKRQANCDYLTGFYNRFYLKEIEPSLAQKENIGITFIDINNLKYTNDCKGHDAGDELIRRISEMIRSHYSGSMIFRIGGDEFVIITEGLTQDDFLSLSQAGRTLFNSTNLAAIGYHFYRRINDLSECIQQCDQTMYEHKRQMKAHLHGIA
jgi:diguanylate cyclase (GGDEF)-like protein